jgi:hypothetical protein
MNRFIICVISLLSFVNSLIRSTGQEEFSPKKRELISYSQNEEDGGRPSHPLNLGKTMFERPPD